MHQSVRDFWVVKTFLLSLGISFIGCSLSHNVDTKNLCNTPADCLNGYTCVQGVCVAINSDSGGVIYPDKGMSPDRKISPDTESSLEDMGPPIPLSAYIGQWESQEIATIGAPLKYGLSLFMQDNNLRGQIIQYIKLGKPAAWSLSFHRKLINVTQVKNTLKLTYGTGVGMCMSLNLSADKTKMVGSSAACDKSTTPENYTFTFLGQSKLCPGLCVGQYCDMQTGSCIGKYPVDVDGHPFTPNYEPDCTSDNDCPQYHSLSSGYFSGSCEVKRNTCYFPCCHVYSGNGWTKENCSDSSCYSWQFCSSSKFCAGK